MAAMRCACENQLDSHDLMLYACVHKAKAMAAGTPFVSMNVRWAVHATVEPRGGMASASSTDAAMQRG